MASEVTTSVVRELELVEIHGDVLFAHAEEAADTDRLVSKVAMRRSRKRGAELRGRGVPLRKRDEVRKIRPKNPRCRCASFSRFSTPATAPGAVLREPMESWLKGLFGGW